MQSFRTLVKEELSGWKPFDIIWLVTVCAVITTVTLLTSNAEAFGNGIGAVPYCEGCDLHNKDNDEENDDLAFHMLENWFEK